MIYYTNGVEILNEVHVKTRKLNPESLTVIEPKRKPSLKWYQACREVVPPIIDGKAVQTYEIYTKSLNQLKTDAKNILFTSCNKALEQLAIDYPERESQTWPVQLEEANRYLADNTSPTPFISAALNDGETVDDYANLIVSSNTAWSDYAGKVVLKRRTFEQRIKDATTVQELDQIVSEINA